MPTLAELGISVEGKNLVGDTTGIVITAEGATLFNRMWDAKIEPGTPIKFDPNSVRHEGSITTVKMQVRGFPVHDTIGFIEEDNFFAIDTSEAVNAELVAA